jgi:hypothetical protein
LGVEKSSQYKHLCHVTHGFLDRLGSNLPLFPEESSANPGAEGQEDILLVDFGHGVQVRCLSPIGHVLQPGVPTVDSGFIIHCCIGNRSPRSVEITLESMAGVGGASCQERFLSCSCVSSLTFKVSPWWWASSSGRSNVGTRGRLGLGGRSTGKEVRDCCHGWRPGSFGTGSSTQKEVRDCCHGRCHCPL